MALAPDGFMPRSWTPSASSTFITRLPIAPGRVRFAVKDSIDVEGTKTSVGSRLVAGSAALAESDAPCLAGLRSEGACIVGKTNLHELEYGYTGINPHFGTPLNPRFPWVIPGGSSSGSAVAVASSDADIAIGTDTAGSVRMPAACCGVVGLKLSRGRMSLRGVWPLAPSLDSIGILGRDVASTQYGHGLVLGEDGPEQSRGLELGRLRGLPAHPLIEAEVGAALSLARETPADLHIDDWKAAFKAARTIVAYEAWRSNRHLFEYENASESIGKDLLLRLRAGSAISESEVGAARRIAAAFEREFNDILQTVQVVVLPTLPVPPPSLLLPDAVDLAALTAPINLGGWPAITLPVPGRGGGTVGSLQMVARLGQESMLLSTAESVERALRRG